MFQLTAGSLSREKPTLISMGFLNTSKLAGLLETTRKLSDVNAADYDAIVVCGGQAPMFTFRGDEILRGLLVRFYEDEKPTAALSHGVASLMDAKRSDGSYLIAGKTMTGFTAGYPFVQGSGGACSGRTRQPAQLRPIWIGYAPLRRTSGFEMYAILRPARATAC